MGRRLGPALCCAVDKGKFLYHEAITPETIECGVDPSHQAWVNFSVCIIKVIPTAWAVANAIHGRVQRLGLCESDGFFIGIHLPFEPETWRDQPQGLLPSMVQIRPSQDHFQTGSRIFYGTPCLQRIPACYLCASGSIDHHTIVQAKCFVFIH